MSNLSLSIRFTLLFSLSLTASSSFFLRQSSPSPSPSSLHSRSSPPFPKATPSDLLSFLGSANQSSEVNPLVARELSSSLKFLVPFSPIETKNSRSFSSGTLRSSNEENELIWWPPEPVLELARHSVKSGGDPDTVHRALDPTVLRVPDVEGSVEDRCQLTRTPNCWRFISEDLNSYFGFLFEVIATRGPTVGLNVSLNRFDLFHGHLFLSLDSGRLGILFHAKDYPAYDEEVFPYNMGYCQIGSNVNYDESMNLRNILWLAPLPSNSTEEWLAPGVLVVLDAHPGGILYRDLIPEYVNYARTIYEDDFGKVVVDVNYLNVGKKVPDHQIFIC
ncbi:hypothetical protein HS088_TW12G01084 [Tripterygium wilfordii]|uniref:Uncharacterized protein n=1 Tax=Tripterygium wilfordii TaxID=458696 RepID=A0A7J7D0M3_TRIWF|nr:uncharacterized protein LOC120010342 [Tripterygium wilfordii]KAF5739873.1 hypothetical protein HS088_TW12G01084 [Tripterygium wilfordii]